MKRRISYWRDPILAVLVTVVGIATASGAELGHSENEVLYAANTGGRVEVYDLKLRRFFVEGQEYLARRDGHHFGEFAGQLVDCGTATHYCVRGGIYVVVPRNISGQRRWSSHGIRCRSMAPLGSNLENTITCAFSKRSTSFRYEGRRGLLSYDDADNEAIRFELVGERGLFAH